MNSKEKISIIHLWTHEFRIVRGQDGWIYSRVTYKPGGPEHSVLYFDYDDMIKSTLDLIMWRVAGCVKNIEIEAKRGY